MIDYELTLLCSVCALAFVNVMCQPDGIFYPVVRLWKNAFGANKLSHVLFECAKCNSAWWMIGVIGYGHYVGFGPSLLQGLFQVMAVVCLTWIFDLLIDKIVLI